MSSLFVLSEVDDVSWFADATGLADATHAERKLNDMSAPTASRGLTAIDWSTALAEVLPRVIEQALAEDIQTGDVTTEATIPITLHYQGVIVAKASGVVAGLDVARAVFAMVDPAVVYGPLLDDGDPVSPGTRVVEISGPARALLTGERVALNFLQRMSGIASLTRRYVEAVAGTNAIILDTRKTVPGLRLLDKYAVYLGGGHNHRIGLYDMAMIKDNHIAAAGGITPAVARTRAMWGDQLPIEVEVQSLGQLEEALGLDVDQIMLDNMGLADMRAAVELVDGRVPLEASGNVSLETVAAIAATGVDYISVGKLTHSVEALDLSFQF